MPLSQNESEPETIDMKISSDYRFNFMQSDFHNNSLAFGLVLKQRHKGLGNDLLSTTNGKDSIPQERCLLLVRILTVVETVSGVSIPPLVVNPM